MTIAKSPMTKPRIWVMIGHKAGDNSQVTALAEAIGWPYEVRRFAYRPWELITNVVVGATLAGVNRARSDPLEPPWPDLIITAGRRNEPICFWIRKQAEKVGQRVRIVQCGRPWALIERFELIVTTPQYRLPRRDNVLRNTTPLHRVTDERLAEEAAHWGARLTHLPKPHVAVVLGGNAGPYTFDEEAAALLGRAASVIAGRSGGSLLITSSARTPARALDAMEAAIDVPAEIYRWSRNAPENPYFGFLGLADTIIVTCDSMSMLTEACFTRKPVLIFDLDRSPESKLPRIQSLIGPCDLRMSWWRWLKRLRLQPIVYRVAMFTGPMRLTRDVRIIHKALIEQGRAVWLGDAFPEGGPPSPLADMDSAVMRVRALFSPKPSEVEPDVLGASEPAPSAADG